MIRARIVFASNRRNDPDPYREDVEFPALPRIGETVILAGVVTGVVRSVTWTPFDTDHDAVLVMHAR